MRLGPWTCDECGSEISHPQGGWVEWLSEPDNLGGSQMSGIRLVHHASASPRQQGCIYAAKPELMYRYSVLDDHMHQFTGPDGLMRLLDMCDPASTRFVSGAVEMTRRLYIPGYEMARMHYADAVANGVIDEAGGPERLSLAAIEAVVEYARQSDLGRG